MKKRTSQMRTWLLYEHDVCVHGACKDSWIEICNMSKQWQVE